MYALVHRDPAQSRSDATHTVFAFVLRLSIVLLGALSFSAMAPHAEAQSPVLLKDINPTGDSDPAPLVNVNGTVFFPADDGISGRELYKSDGTTAGTVQVKDIRPGSIGSSPRNLKSMNGMLFFTANDGSGGEELWKSDGTPAGTVMVKDIVPGAGGSTPQALTPINGLLFFSASDGIAGIELWRSNGTAAGTALVKDIRPGTEHSLPQSLAEFNGLLYFGANDGVTGTELWKSDGTSSGTVLVKDLSPASGSPQLLTNMNGTLFFSASGGTNSWELWRSDGTAPGTVMVRDVSTAGAAVDKLTVGNGLLYFRVDDGVHGRELWKSDGTAGGTVMVRDVNPYGHSDPDNLIMVGETLYFTVMRTGWELWKSDGTYSGTTRVSTLSGAGDSFKYPSSFTLVNGTLYFRASDEDGILRLWKSDGTAAGTVDLGLEMSSLGLLGAAGDIVTSCPYVYLRGKGPSGLEPYVIDLSQALFYSDLDGDGFGRPPGILGLCGVAGYAIQGGDCNDSDPTIHPGALETVCNGIDNNCTGTIDENVECICVGNGPGLAGWWRGNGNTNDDAAGNHATLVGPVTYAPGRVGEAFQLDGLGASVAGLGDVWSYAFVQNTGVFTILAWIQLTNINQAGYQPIAASTYSSEAGFVFYWSNVSGERRLALDLLRGSGLHLALAASPNQTITTQGWHHVAVVGNGTNITFYVDGVAYPGSGTISGNKPFGPSSRPVELGGCGAIPSCDFNGMIDEAQIYDRALTGAEIRAIFDTGANGTCGTGCLRALPGLVGWWPGTGNSKDASGFNHHATGGIPAFAHGKVGPGFFSTGVKFVDIPDYPDLEATTQLTLAAWVFPTETALNNSARILSKWMAGSSAYEMIIHASDELLLRGDISNDGINYDAIVASSPLEYFEWSHAAMTFDAGVWKLYVNGVLVASQVSAIQSIFASGTSPLSIGRYPDDPLQVPTQIFYGGIDEPMVFRRALNEAEIRSLYEAGASGMCAIRVVSAVEVEETIPVFSLAKPWPNPAGDVTNIRFRTPTRGSVRAEVYDVAGRRVATLHRGEELPAGEHHVTWNCRGDNGRQAAAGIYFFRVTAGGATSSQKIAIVRP